jgi:hypothetical protein
MGVDDDAASELASELAGGPMAAQRFSDADGGEV